MNRLLLLFIAGILSASCAFSDKDDAQQTWIGGEIVNPEGDYIIISQDRIPMDTIPLKNDNTFLYQFENPEEGLYSFRHNEYQVFYLEPGDSIMVRLNTLEFDESLSFSGRGAEKNNLLIEFFLQNETENNNLKQFYHLSPSNFESKIDSMRAVREQRYKEFLRKYEPSEGFKKIAKLNIAYDHFSRKEHYIAANKRRLKKSEYPKGFFEFRDCINYNNNIAEYYYPYYRFLGSHFANLAFEKLQDNDIDTRDYDFNKTKLVLIDSMIKNDSLKNRLLLSSVRQYLVQARSEENERKMVTLFKDLSSHPNHITEIEELASAAINITPGHTIPNVQLVTTDNIVKNLHEIIRRPTVLYFWSMYSMQHNRNIHAKVAELRSKFPEYDYMGINTDTHFRKWRDMTSNLDFNPAHEFQLEDLDTAEKELVLNSLNKAFLVDSENIILESNSSVFEPQMEEQLLGYLNQ
ncbi:hypothetical protein [Luteirhabdus pelagi]|uniref:hypothetical protein n=1 Tax=Luteirhabdus pelagi TaxID=2792783 RepID=UPI001939BAE7|nr:hypothetical protein [Luteirhabdus pelagi]